MSTRAQDLSEMRIRALDAGIALVGESRVFVDLLHAVRRIAQHGTATVLIRGETGTGKELIARAVHYLGARRDFAFVPVNCGALPESLAENELFGHRPGAFTDASRESVGLVRLAHKGTLFLDEVDSLPPRAQVALLRFLQDGHFRPLGAAREEHANVRIIAASNGPLEQAIAAGRFRADLYYRLNLLALQIPPLRVRSGDVHVLAEHFLKQCNERYGFADKCLHASTSRWFEHYSWPGNIRELENLLHREYLLSEDREIQIDAPCDANNQPVPVSSSAAGQLSYRAAKSRVLQEFDRNYLSELLRQTDGNITKAAQLAGKERRALGKLLKRYRLSGHTCDDC